MFRRGAESWEPEALLGPVDPGHRGFGGSVDLYGSALIVGTPTEYTVECPEDDPAGTGPDADVYEERCMREGVGAELFYYTDGEWIPGPILPTPEPPTRYGYDVAIGERWVVVGDPGDSEVAPGAGAIYIY